MSIELIVDANILFAALLAKKTTRELLFNPRLKLYAPEYLLAELYEHLQNDEEIQQKLQQTKEETDKILNELLNTIEVIPLKEYASLIPKAIQTSPDEYDAPYFALALHLNITLWSNEKKLKNQNTVKVITTQELIQKLETNPT